MSIFFLSKKLASFCHKNSVLTDYYSSGEYVGYWLCYITKVRASFYNMSRSQRFCSLFSLFLSAKTSSSEDNLTVNRLVMIISYELLYIIN